MFLTHAGLLSRTLYSEQLAQPENQWIKTICIQSALFSKELRVLYVCFGITSEYSLMVNQIHAINSAIAVQSPAVFILHYNWPGRNSFPQSTLLQPPRFCNFFRQAFKDTAINFASANIRVAFTTGTATRQCLLGAVLTLLEFQATTISRQELKASTVSR